MITLVSRTTRRIYRYHIRYPLSSQLVTANHLSAPLYAATNADQPVSNTGQPTKFESVAISASNFALSTTCWPRKKSVMARGIPSAGSRVVFAQLRKDDKVYGLRTENFEHGTFLFSQGRGANFCLKSWGRFPPTSTDDKSAVSL